MAAIRSRIPASHQPTKAEMEEVIVIDGTHEEIAPAVLRWGAPFRKAGGRKDWGG